ncbi:hypothetical protein LTS08_004563 [Lithohypha guttulata]|nr:hypothetical protein LTS08_004563 [Lithohypha guttulata]
MPNGLEERELWTTISNGHFWSVDEEILVQQIYAAFRPETNRLRSACAIERNTPPVLDGNLPRTPSEILFDGENYDEVNRTYVGILALRWTWNDDYERFTRGQVEKLKLTRKSFRWLHDYFRNILRTPMDLLTIVLAMVVNDLGKDHSLINDLHKLTGTTLVGRNHDTILLEAAHAGIIPSLRYLDGEHRQDFMLGLELGSELNAGQLAQAENVPVNLEGLLTMQGHERAFNLKFIEQILDVAGAAGHVYADGIKNLIEPVFQAFKTVHEVSLCIIRKDCNLRQGYDQVLSKRAALLHDEGFKLLSVAKEDERALLRLLTMGRAATLETAKLLQAAFDDVDPYHRQLLIEGLNIDAIEDNETAVIPYYMPAMIAETIRSTRGSGKEQEALTSLMRYLSKALKYEDVENANTWSPLSPTRESSATWPSTLPLPKLSIHIPAPTDTRRRQTREGRVIERNMSSARETISSPRFKEDPSVLDGLPPPEGHLLSRRRTSHSV